MTREITHEAKGPIAFDEDDLEEQDGTAYICMCGLSDNRPFCDSSHSATADEADNVVYKYEGDDDENPRREIEELVFADD